MIILCFRSDGGWLEIPPEEFSVHALPAPGDGSADAAADADI
jgi:hypothetical protein